MKLFQLILLGIVQGFTEFLPVSSSGHLVLVGEYFEFLRENGIVVETILHAGTLLSILVYFRKHLFSFYKNNLNSVIVATLPAVFIGYLFSDAIEAFFKNAKIVAFALIATGAINILTDKIKSKGKKQVSFENALIIGIFQAFAIIPGISRSGSTIFAARKLGLEKKLSLQYSFLLSVPAVIGANLYELIKYPISTSHVPIEYLLIGFTAAFVSGYFAILLVYKFLNLNRFKIFGTYCLLLGFVYLLAIS